MNWEEYADASEKILGSPLVPSSLDIIALIKKVNPTRLTLSENDRERGYQLKNRLQSLLLEHYGDTFYLIPHPASPNIILIKHRALPTIDACHADLASLSSEAIERLQTEPAPPPGREQPKHNREKRPPETGAVLPPKEALKKAQALLEEYDYAAAEEVLAGIRVQGSGDLQVLARGAGILLHEMGAFPRCIETLLCQPKTVLKDRGIRELLAVAYHHNGAIAEARALLNERHPAELGLEALFAYADIAFKDGNLSAAMDLVRIARGQEGFLSGFDPLQKEIEAAMLALAEPVARKARAAFQSGAIEEARSLAREALRFYPECQEARAVISAIETMDEEVQVAELWARLEKEPSGERRCALLATLLERDKERREIIRKLIAEEKERQRQMFFDGQLEALRNLVLEERWPECYDCVMLLMGRQEFPARAGEILSLSPFFAVLHENKRLHGLSERSAKELWLRFIKAKSALAAGDGEGCFENFEELKPWFDSCAEFQKDYLELLRREQEKVRKESAHLLEQSGDPHCPDSEVRRSYGGLRRRIQLLPLEERRALVRVLEERLAPPVAKQDPGQSLQEYREALQIGNSEKAAYLRQEIADRLALETIDAEFAAAFHIALEPLTLEVSDDLPMDLTTPPPLLISFGVRQRFFLKESPDTYVMIDFSTKNACRMTSPVFERTRICDSLGEGSFLFIEKKGEDGDGDQVWRAELSVERAAFTASFNVREWFDVEDGFSAIVLLSSERETDYYALIEHDEGRAPAKVLRKRLTPKAIMETLQLGNLTKVRIWRWTSDPDSFIVGGEGEMRHVNRNLTTRGGVSSTPDIYKLDADNGWVYGVENGWLTKRGRKLEFIKYYDKAASLAIFGRERVHGLSIQTETALIVLGNGQQAFYNLADNTFSNKIRVGRVIPSGHDGKWYSFDYDSKERKLRLREITEVIHSELEWREVFRRKDKRNKRCKRAVWFNDNDNFVYRPEQWDPSGPGAEK